MVKSELKNNFPNLYRRKFEFKVGDGWLPLIWKLSAILEHEISEQKKEVQREMFVTEVKVRYGTLYFHMNYATDRMNKLIEKAEIASGEICEFCGQMGIVRNKAYITCETHKEFN